MDSREGYVLVVSNPTVLISRRYLQSETPCIGYSFTFSVTAGLPNGDRHVGGDLLPNAVPLIVGIQPPLAA